VILAGITAFRLQVSNDLLKSSGIVVFVDLIAASIESKQIEGLVYVI